MCAFKGTSKHDGLCLIDDIEDYSRKVDFSGIIVSLDQKKAFDLVFHEVLFAAMEYFKLPGQVRGVTTRVSVNGSAGMVAQHNCSVNI